MSDIFTLKLEGEELLANLIAQQRHRVEGIPGAFPIIAELLHAAVEDVVQMEGPGWPALAPSTLLKRRKAGRGEKMLQDTGLMMTTLTESTGPDYAAVTFGVPYAKYHIGNEEKPGRRNPFKLDPVAAGLIEDINEVLLKGIAD